MPDVSVRELRNQGGSVIERVLQGEIITVTKSGTPVAELHPLRHASLTAQQLVARWVTVPTIDAVALRRDVDGVLDASL